MTIKEIDEKMKALADAQYNLGILRDWMLGYESGLGFEDFPLKEIRINPMIVDITFCRKGANDWFLEYFKNNSPQLDDELAAYTRVHSWLSKFQPSDFATLGNCRSMELVCCSAWLIITAMKYGFNCFE